MSKTPIALKPVAGFCVKSSTIRPAVFTPPHPQNNLLEPTAPITIPVGFKVFANIAWDLNVPPPPAGSEEVIHRAMQGQDLDDGNPDSWYVPVVVSNGRQDTDKAGKPSLVFDCIYNTSIKSRTLTDPEFKLFIVGTQGFFTIYAIGRCSNEPRLPELALQRIEAQTSLPLSRQIGTPNIASKGKLSPRTVYIPSVLVTQGALQAAPTLPPTPTTEKPLIQDVTPVASSVAGTKHKGILKPASSAITQQDVNAQRSRPTWSWTKEGSKIQIKVQVPNLVRRLTFFLPQDIFQRRVLSHHSHIILIPLQPRALIEQATFDIEPRRFILSIPDRPVLDVNLGLSDAEIVAAAAAPTSASLHEANGSEPNNTLTLKRQRPFDVEGATSEWRVAESSLVILA
ncbi:hypothetical protein C0991_000620 [Blastosporella zonata]|nr:hypothetical protein C0991_000620 [Blastosporella zonata]